MEYRIVSGDLLDQKVDAIVNPWNRNLIPWWLLLPQGVSGAIKRRAGFQPFRELRKFGVLPLGGAATTSAGRLPFKGIIHVAGLNHFWMSSEQTIRLSIRSALAEARTHAFESLAFPLIGAGTGGLPAKRVISLMIEEISSVDQEGECLIVTYEKKGG